MAVRLAAGLIVVFTLTVMSPTVVAANKAVAATEPPNTTSEPEIHALLKGPPALAPHVPAVVQVPPVPLVFQYRVAALVSCGISVAARAAPAISAVRGRGFEPIRRAAARSQVIDDGFRTQYNFSSVTTVALS